MPKSQRFRVRLDDSIEVLEGRITFDYRDLIRTKGLYSTSPNPDAIIAIERGKEMGFIRYTINRAPYDGFKVAIEFALKLICRCDRCLEPLHYTIGDQSSIKIDGSQADPTHYSTVGQALDFREVFEEEALMRVPIAFHHPHCSIGQEIPKKYQSFVKIGRPEKSGAESYTPDANQVESEDTWQPFANIKSLIDSS